MSSNFFEIFQKNIPGGWFLPNHIAKQPFFIPFSVFSGIPTRHKSPHFLRKPIPGAAGLLLVRLQQNLNGDIQNSGKRPRFIVRNQPVAGFHPADRVLFQNNALGLHFYGEGCL